MANEKTKEQYEAELKDALGKVEQLTTVIETSKKLEAEQANAEAFAKKEKTRLSELAIPAVHKHHAEYHASEKARHNAEGRNYEQPKVSGVKIHDVRIDDVNPNLLHIAAFVDDVKGHHFFRLTNDLSAK